MLTVAWPESKKDFNKLKTFPFFSLFLKGHNNNNYKERDS